MVGGQLKEFWAGRIPTSAVRTGPEAIRMLPQGMGKWGCKQSLGGPGEKGVVSPTSLRWTEAQSLWERPEGTQ